MKQATHFKVQPGWKIVMADMGLQVADVLTLAGLPADLFSRPNAVLSVMEYFALWNGLEQAARSLSTDLKELPLLIGQAISVEAFDPPIFASFCSPNLNVALHRLQEFKRLIGPMVLDVSVNDQATTASVHCYNFAGPLPRSVGATELVFLTKLARMATRHGVKPLSVTLAQSLDDNAPYEAFFGVAIRYGQENRVVFSAEDAKRPFLTENLTMWQFFEPELRKRLSDLEMEASTVQRVKSALLEMLPSGLNTIEHMADRLAMSKRTLQRRLSSEEVTYQQVLQEVRQELAKHYLKQPHLTQGEISYLLGFQDTNSFTRAYSHWTGSPPGQFRSLQ